MKMNHKKNKEWKVYYSEFELTPEVMNYFLFLFYLSQLNLLLEKKLITNSEYEKVKYVIEKKYIIINNNINI